MESARDSTPTRALRHMQGFQQPDELVHTRFAEVGPACRQIDQVRGHGREFYRRKTDQVAFVV
ncbi:MAG TPA: hypothetical protein VJT49_14455 [Amycolatopsis sp.]|uniref:hypothetical protein n=1 Tax=Amycolatopsis sp. TaxID=37632 RepID=UPI002B489E5E|nr:hypothetical protein [Amycolatopsis sp.]HKS46282.1 hypothetical protein [Amycolatopsis sp.]